MALDIAFCVGGMPFDGGALTSQSLGGSETAGLCLARELAALGHRVRMFCNTEDRKSYDGVHYYPISDWARWSTEQYFDVAVVQRLPQAFSAQLASKINILWCHDLALRRYTNEFRGVLWNVNRVALVSRFMAEQYRETHGLPERLMFVTRNGIDLDIVGESKPWDERKQKRLIYSARPERGLDVLVGEVFPKMLQRDPNLELVIAGYNNPVDHMAPFYGQIDHMIEQFGGRVKKIGHLNKPDLYRAYGESALYVYPTPSPQMAGFCEVSCISAMEAQACGLPFISTDKGALKETVAPDAGILLQEGENYADRFAEAALGVLNDPVKWQAMSDAGVKHAQSLSWAGVAREWEAEFDRVFAEVNDDPYRLARHFYINSDIVAAKAVAESADDDRCKSILRQIDRHYGFMASPETFNQYYREYGKETDARLSQVNIPKDHFWKNPEPRFHAILAILRDRPEIKTVLDYGCGHGWFDVFLSNNLQDRKVTGVDIDPGAVKWSETYANKFAAARENLTFIEADHTFEHSEQFDCLVVQEVLEHVPDPKAVMDALERHVKPGGLVIVTTPSGPIEYGEPTWYGYRQHIRHFETSDLTDMFGAKPAVVLQGGVIRRNEKLQRPCGFNLVTFRADHEPCGEIDMARKLKYQAPRQSLSAFLLGGPGTENMARSTLNSIVDIADEIVFADTGLSQAGRELLEEYGVRIVPSVNPTTHGFARPRNDGLEQCRMDWALWIDTDEILTDAPSLHKYLRENIFNGYAIRQHHFAIDTRFDPDMPVRVFRNRASDGKTMRFWGAVHEHPELELNKGPGEVVIVSDVNIGHVSYLTENIRRGKFMRNRPLLLKDMADNPDRLLQKHFAMRDNMLLCMYEAERSGGVVTQTMVELCQETIDLYHKHFADGCVLANIEPEKFYSEALRVLNQGVEASIDIRVRKDGHGADMNGAPGYRFADVDELEKFISRKAKEAVEPYRHKWW